MNGIKWTKRLAGALVALVLGLSLAVPALAIPVVPLTFIGDVTIDSGDARIGTTISAEIESAEVASTDTTIAGRYAISIDYDSDYIGKTVVLKVNGAFGGDGTYVDPTETPVVTVDLAIEGEAPGALVADAGGPYSGTVSHSVSLSGSASGGTLPYSYAWDLDNDGAYDDSTAQNPSYTWDTAGDYTVGLQVTDDVGGMDTDTASVDISAAPVALVADAGGPYTGTAGESVSLSGSASGGTPPYSYAWDLDDDGAYDDSIAQNPSHTWADAGDYTVGLKVTDAASDTALDTASVHVSAAAAPPSGGVGGTAYPPDKLAILAPYILLLLGFILVGGIAWLVLRRRRAYS